MTTMITPTLKRVLATLARFRFVSTSMIQTRHFSHATPASARVMTSRALSGLRQLGLIDRMRAMDAEYVHFLTVEGARMMNVEGGHQGVRLADYEHDLLITHVDYALELDQRVQHIITERQQRSQEPNAELNPWALPITRTKGSHGYAWPDLITINTNNAMWGHELEYSPKGKDRLERLMYAYGVCPKFAGAVYYTVPETHNLVTECAEKMNQALIEHGHGRQIVVRQVAKVLGWERATAP